jgi:hypothetical protein
VIWLTQWLCEQRHCAFVMAWDETKSGAAEVERVGIAVASSGVVTNRCGICGGGIKPESEPTIFATMKEAVPALVAFQSRQIATRRALDAMGMTIEKLDQPSRS